MVETQDISDDDLFDLFRSARSAAISDQQVHAEVACFMMLRQAASVDLMTGESTPIIADFDHPAEDAVEHFEAILDRMALAGKPAWDSRGEFLDADVCTESEAFATRLFLFAQAHGLELPWSFRPLQS